jgi:SAM-dependent methyltransferase
MSGVGMNDRADQTKADVADLLDLQLSPLGLRAIGALAPIAGESILDVGCGAGQTVLQLADLVGPKGRVTGVDIAPTVLDVARHRSVGYGNVSFLETDALTLARPDRSLDGVFSRFGVMAFTDPVATFSNLRRMMKPSGRLAFVCWRTLDENELDGLPLRAAGLEEWVDSTPFRFAEPTTIRTTLRSAGFHAITIEAHDARVSSGNLDAMIVVLLSVGALGKIIRDHPEMKTAAESRVRTALAARGANGAVALTAATWIVTARP